MKLISTALFTLLLQMICFGNAYFLNCDTCGFSQINCDTSYGSKTDTTIAKTIIDSQMICTKDTCCWNYAIHYDTTKNTYQIPIINCKWLQCIKYSLFDNTNQGYKILPYAMLYSPSLYPSCSGYICKIDSLWGVTDTTSSINNKIYFEYSSDTVRCQMIISEIFGINELNGDTLWGCQVYKDRQTLTLRNSFYNQNKINELSYSDLINVLIRDPKAIRIFSLQGKEISISNYNAFNKLSKGVYLITYKSKSLIKILK